MYLSTTRLRDRAGRVFLTVFAGLRSHPLTAPGMCASVARHHPQPPHRMRPSAYPGACLSRHPHSWSPAMATPLSDPPCRSPRPRSRPSPSSASARWAPASPRSWPRPAARSSASTSARPPPPRPSPRWSPPPPAPCERGRLTEQERAGRPGPRPHLHRPAGRGRRRPGDRGGAGVVRDQAADLPRAGRDRAPGDDPGDRHQRPVGHAAGRRLGPPRAGARPALLQPGAGDEAGRGRLLGADRAGRRRRRHRPRPRPRQGARRGRRPARIRRRRPAVRLPQPGRRDVRGEVRLPRGHRRRDAAGLRPADGPAGPAGPDRRRHRAHGPGGDVRRVPRPAARPRPDPASSSARRA